MSTKFVRATNNITGYVTQAHDTDSPMPVFKEVLQQNTQNNHTMSDWKFDLLDYKLDRIGEYDWRNTRILVSLGDLFD